jgi:mono/diheme cytochrome c family protein
MAAGGQTKKTEMFPTPNVGHGKEVFEEKCAICHYATSDAMKIGPGLRGFSKRGGFSGTRGRVLDDSLRSWIESGDTKMPPMKGKLDASELRDVIAYVKTL